MFDSHCHLTDLADPDKAIAQARAAGVTRMLTCGYHRRSNEQVLALHQRHPDLDFALGLHPWHADEPVEAVVELIETHRPTAIGEIGLDVWNKSAPHGIERQTHVLEVLLELAARLSLPVSLHCRKALHLLLPILRRFPTVRGVLHAFSGSVEQAQPFIEQGFLIGVGGAITRWRASRIRACARRLCADHIVLETDAPAIPMENVRPMEVCPHHLPLVRDALAELQGTTPQHIEQVTDRNACAVFGAVFDRFEPLCP